MPHSSRFLEDSAACSSDPPFVQENVKLVAAVQVHSDLSIVAACTNTGTLHKKKTSALVRVYISEVLASS